MIRSGQPGRVSNPRKPRASGDDPAKTTIYNYPVK